MWLIFFQLASRCLATLRRLLATSAFLRRLPTGNPWHFTLPDDVTLRYYGNLTTYTDVNVSHTADVDIVDIISNLQVKEFFLSQVKLLSECIFLSFFIFF